MASKGSSFDLKLVLALRFGREGLDHQFDVAFHPTCIQSPLYGYTIALSYNSGNHKQGVLHRRRSYVLHDPLEKLIETDKNEDDWVLLHTISLLRSY